MEWTDGMEYQLMNVDKTLHCSRGEVVSAVSPLLASTGLLCTSSLRFLASYPGPHVECFVMEKAMFWYIIHGFDSVNVR